MNGLRCLIDYKLDLSVLRCVCVCTCVCAHIPTHVCACILSDNIELTEFQNQIHAKIKRQTMHLILILTYGMLQISICILGSQRGLSESVAVDTGNL